MANEKLSTFLEANIEHLTEMWIQAVRSDARIDSDAALSRLELRDHVPAIIEEICELLRADETPSPPTHWKGASKSTFAFNKVIADGSLRGRCPC